MLENQELQEGINDTAIFKAVFLAGGPGSGKSFIGTEKRVSRRLSVLIQNNLWVVDN